jgi:hypothetical protein
MLILPHTFPAFLSPSLILTQTKPNVGSHFHTAVKNAYRREHDALAVRHIRHVRMSGDLNNNKMERFNGEVRDREKIVRGVKKQNSPLLKGYQICHNYMRPHMALEGKTPSGGNSG